MIRVFDPVAQSSHRGYAPFLGAMYGEKKMPAYTGMSDEQLDALIAYLNEPVGEMPYDPKVAYDSCAMLVRELNRLSRIWKSLTHDNGKETTVTQDENPGGPENGPGYKPSDMLFPESRVAQYYTFNIQTQGWYNVDVFLGNVPGFVNSNLTVVTQGLYTDNAQLFFLLPDQNIFAQGALLPGQTNVWGFFKDNGDITLPQGARAFIYLIGSSGEQLSFASTAFTTQTKLQLSLTAQAAKKNTIDSMLNAPGFAGFAAGVGESRNARELKSIEAALRRLDTLLYRRKCLPINYPEQYTTLKMLDR